MLSVRVDDRVRLASSVMLLTKHFGDLQSWALQHPLRIATKKFLAEFKDHPCVRFFDEIAQHYFMNTIYQLALLCTPPPRIEWKNKGSPPIDRNNPLGKKVLAFFPMLMSEFFEDTGISSLWEQRREEWEATVAQCKTILSSCNLAGWLRDFYGEPQLDLILVPNPTDPCSFGFGPTLGNEIYAILGPLCRPKKEEFSNDDFFNDPTYVMVMAFHEFSHGILGRILSANKKLIKDTEHLSTRNKLKGYFPKFYSTWESQLTEILIRACTALFISDTEGESTAIEFLEEEKKKYGIFLVDDIYSGLKYYNNKRKAEPAMKLSDYLPILFASLSKKRN